MESEINSQPITVTSSIVVSDDATTEGDEGLQQEGETENGDKDKLLARRHFSKAEVDQTIYSLYIHVYVQVSNENSSREFLDPSLPSSSKECSGEASEESEMKLLDLYFGCGAMSTGLCLGAATSEVKLVTKWAVVEMGTVDLNKDTCKSLKLNHPDTKVRNEAALDYLSLLKEWRIV
ncbi:hypothetical protein IFM89_026149 [Coptis chinensis]|uniref:Uncharacterized protein n=1 Tax=Coptis chinensis TaxID=261450 RepID=A0A835IEM3_9MAGN|nr:hypothetical protein IFM89_026149 [Coptis chinensis]